MAWGALEMRQLPPPWRPALTSADDTHYFEGEGGPAETLRRDERLQEAQLRVATVDERAHTERAIAEWAPLWDAFAPMDDGGGA